MQFGTAFVHLLCLTCLAMPRGPQVPEQSRPIELIGDAPCRTTKTFGSGPSWEAQVFGSIVLRNLLPAEFDKASITEINNIYFNNPSFRFFITYKDELPTRQLKGTLTLGKAISQFEAEDRSAMSGGFAKSHEVIVPATISKQMKTALDAKQNGRLVLKADDQVILKQDLDGRGFAEALAFAEPENKRIGNLADCKPRGTGGDFPFW